MRGFLPVGLTCLRYFGELDAVEKILVTYRNTITLHPGHAKIQLLSD